MEAIRAKLLAQATKGQDRGERKSGDNASYPFWNIPDGSSSTIRFLPDGDEENIFFWVERQTLKLPFDGVVGGDYPTNKKVEVTVPCVDMFGMTCPVIAATRSWWNQGEAEKQMARMYYKKRSYIFQGFVVQSSFEEKEPPENPIRRFIVGPSLYKIIHQSLAEPQFEDNPTDYTGGRDFVIRKTRQGEYANYSTSNWSFKSRSLSEAEMAAVQKFGLKDLKEFKGAVPDADAVAAIKAMFEDSLAGKPYDFDSYGRYYKPWEARGGNGETASEGEPEPATTVAARPAPVRETVAAAAPAAAAPAAAGGRADPKDVIARIKARTLAKD